jgi:predicted RNA-binding protein with PIN domain
MRYLLVDGHSIIFKWPDLRALQRHRGGAARDELVRRLTQYQDATSIRVVAVFDGKGDKKASEESEPGGIQIFYSGKGLTADTIIERLCALYATEHDIVVATDDNMERQTALTFGASTVSSEMLRGMLEDADRDLHRRIEERRKGY